jgi:HEAT repeat protein
MKGRLPAALASVASFAPLVAALSLPLAASCAASPALRAVERGDRDALRDEIARRERAGDLSTGEAACLAHAVADRDLRGAAAGASDVVRDLGPCARELDGALAARMQMADAAGAEAALALVDVGAVDARDLGARALATPESPWRAVAARGLVRPEDHDARLRALGDPDPKVRRQAARAARAASDPADLGALLEAARVDPEPIVRTEAVRSVATLPPGDDDRVASALADLWTSGDEGLQEDIAIAWARPALWSAGGRERLRDAVAAQHGPGAVEAAASILRTHASDHDAAPLAVALLLRSIDGGGRAVRLQAIAEAPVERPEFSAAIRRASKDDDREVRVAALARLAHDDSQAASALEELAQPGSPVSARARFALAVAGDRRIQAWLEQDLGAEAPDERLAAAVALAALGVPSRAAPLLADASSAVRDRAACAIVMASRIRH